MTREQAVRILRRVNLGNYEHFELDITIYDENEDNGLKRALEVFAKAVEKLDLQEKVKIKKQYALGPGGPTEIK